MFEAEGFYSVCKKAVKKLILPLVEEIKDHITNERITLMGQFDASNERLNKAVTDQLRQTSEALQRLLDSDAEKAELRDEIARLQEEIQGQIAQQEQTSTLLESDDPVVQEPAPVEEPVVPVEEPVVPVDPGFNTNMPVEETAPVGAVEEDFAQPDPVVEAPVSETPDPNAPAASH